MNFSPRTKRYLKCCVSGCVSNVKKSRKTRFNLFPNSKRTMTITSDDGSSKIVYVREMWKKAMNVKSPVRNQRVCSLHFNPDDYTFPELHTHRRKLKNSAVPSLNLYTDYSQQVSESSFSTENIEEVPGNFKNEQGQEKNETCDCTSEVVSPRKLSAAQTLVELQNQLFTVPVTKKIEDKMIQVISGDIYVPFVSLLETGKQLKTMCGISSFKVLEKLEFLISDLYPEKRKHKLSVKERIILTTMKLKLDLNFEVLCILFKCVSAKTCSNIFYETLKQMSAILQSVLQWVTTEETKRNIPVHFSNFRHTAIIVDCTEISIEKPKCLKCRIKFYSHYKSNFTVKFMTGVTPGGIINFVSESYGGRFSDKAIFEQSNVINMLIPNMDAIMTDKGFLIDDICNKYDIKLIRPPFLRNQSSMNEKDAILNREIASARVHVERMNEKIKKFAILNNKVKWHLVKYIDDIFIVCCGLANLSSPILGSDKFISQ